MLYKVPTLSQQVKWTMGVIYGTFWKTELILLADPKRTTA